ncbi:hypothetical protein KKI23_00980 [Patescibacteria group bacterium]|nr:hypothetical protein [Patescibacteria group bacterium]
MLLIMGVFLLVADRRQKEEGRYSQALSLCVTICLLIVFGGAYVQIGLAMADKYPQINELLAIGYVVCWGLAMWVLSFVPIFRYAL